MLRFAVISFTLTILALGFTSCDSGENTCDLASSQCGGNVPLLRVVVVDSQGLPLTGVPVRLCYGDCVDGLPGGNSLRNGQPREQVYESHRFGGEGDVYIGGSPYPNPVIDRMLTTVFVATTQRIRFEVLDLRGSVIDVLSDSVHKGNHTYQYQWQPSESVVHGVYQLLVVGEQESDSAYAVYSDVREGYYLNGHLVMPIGFTDTNGGVVVDDPTKFPFLYDGLSEPDRTDETGELLGTIDLGRQATFILGEDSTGLRGYLRTLEDSGNEIELIVD